jgi:hypothetical protein
VSSGVAICTSSRSCGGVRGPFDTGGDATVPVDGNCSPVPSAVPGISEVPNALFDINAEKAKEENSKNPLKELRTTDFPFRDNIILS